MRRVLFIGTMCLLIIITALWTTIGFHLGAIELWGVKQIRQENFDIDSENAKLSELIETTYPSSTKSLEEMAEKMQSSKTEYENKAVLLNNSDYYLQTEEYEIEFLWTKIGNYAKDNDIVLKIEVTESQLEGRYDLNFTAVGKYANITQLIYDIENDSKLGFKIENFKMQASGDAVEATFSCKEIRIDIDESKLQNNVQGTEEIDVQENEADVKDNTSENNTTNTESTTESNTTNNVNSTNATTESNDIGADDIIAEQ